MLTELFEDSLAAFFHREASNILSGVSERNLCGRFAMLLENYAHERGFTGYYADTEYNRKQGGKIKTILNNDFQVINVTCDIILHSRGEIIENDNLIAIEMKKSERPEVEKESDRLRLRALTKASFDGVWSFDGKTHPEHVCGYDFGYFIEIDKEARSYNVQQFRRGKQIGNFSGHFG